MFGLLRGPHQTTRVSLMIRCMWILMLVIHLPALFIMWQLFLKEGAESVRLSSFLGLNLATLFFLLKIRGARLLEFTTNRHSLLTIVVAVTLMHANAVGMHLKYAAVPQDVNFAAGILFAAAFSRVQQFFGRLLSRTRTTRNTATLSRRAMWSCQHQPHQPRYAACLCAPRAPPSSSYPR